MTVQELHIETETQLIEECIAGKRKAQYALYERYASAMYPICMRYSKTTHEADDILQLAFVKVFQNLEDFKQDCPLEFWIKRIIINTALKQNRRLIDKAPKEEVTEYNGPVADDTVAGSYNFEELLEFVRQLAPRYQMVFNLYAIEGYKHREIAEMLDISEGTSKSQYARAKHQLQEMIAKEEQRHENT